MEKFRLFEQKMRDELEAEGIELLFPIAPDLYLSDEEEDIPTLKDEPTPPPPQETLETLRARYQGAYELMAKSPLHNHFNRKLTEQREFFDRIRTGIPGNPGSSTSVEYIDVEDDITPEKFQSQFVMKGGTPVILRGVMGGWKARERWGSPDIFLHHYGDIPVKIMEKNPEHGMGRPYIVRLPLSLYWEYTQTNVADDPFYAFEDDLSSGRRSEFLGDYVIPTLFRDDLYAHNVRTREFYPNYRHLIIGGERTGTPLHVDPKCTGAWNALLSGHKKWAIFPPGDSEKYLEEIGAKAYAKQPAAYWWQDIAPKIGAHCGMIECIQSPGEIIFIPAGWWHSVLNLDFTIAITENLLIPVTLPLVWPELRSGWPMFTEYLEETAPELVGKIAKESVGVVGKGTVVGYY